MRRGHHTLVRPTALLCALTVAVCLVARPTTAYTPSRPAAPSRGPLAHGRGARAGGAATDRITRLVKSEGEQHDDARPCDCAAARRGQDRPRLRGPPYSEGRR